MKDLKPLIQVLRDLTERKYAMEAEWEKKYGSKYIYAGRSVTNLEVHAMESGREIIYPIETGMFKSDKVHLRPVRKRIYGSGNDKN